MSRFIELLVRLIPKSDPEENPNSSYFKSLRDRKQYDFGLERSFELREKEVFFRDLRTDPDDFENRHGKGQ